MKKIWVVGANSGEYSDRREWIVASFLEEEDAKKCCVECFSKAELCPKSKWSEMKEFKSVIDPQLTASDCYDGVHYCVYPIQLFDKFNPLDYV